MILQNVLLLTCVACLPYIFTLKADFVFDDTEAILKNKDVISESWIDCFQNDFWGSSMKSNLSHKSYRPLTVWTFRLNYLIANGNLYAIEFKIVNLLCHVICCLIVHKFYCVLLEDVTGRTNGSQLDLGFQAALLFSVHPVHVEAISGIVGRADVLAAIMFFSAFIIYLKAMTNSRTSCIYLFFTIFLAFISMLCKENGITVLGLCIIYDIIKNSNSNTLSIKHNKISKHVVIRISLLAITTVLLLYGRWSVMGGVKPLFKPVDNPAAFSDSFFVKVATHSYIYFLNFLLFVWPQWLCYDWSMGCVPLVHDITDLRLMPVIISSVYTTVLLKYLLKRSSDVFTKRLVLVSVALIAVPYLPASNILFPVGFVIAERILYIPSAGYCLLVTIGLHRVIRFGGKKSRKISLFLFYLLVLTYGLRSWQRSHDWKNERNLFLSGMSVCPLNAKVHYNVAKIADAESRTDEAITEYREAIRLFPGYYQAMNNLANLLKNKKSFAEAETHLRKAISYKQDFPAAWMNLGIVLASTGRHDESQSAYRTALQYRTNYPDCLYNLGNLFLEMNKTEDALQYWLKAVNSNNTHALAWTNILTLLDNTGQMEKAMHMIPNALHVLPDSPSVTFAVANIYGKIGHYKDAEKYFLKAIHLFGDRVNAIHYANFGVLYHRWKKFQLAEKMYKKALKLDPSYKSAKNNLQNLKSIKNAQ